MTPFARSLQLSGAWALVALCLMPGSSSAQSYGQPPAQGYAGQRGYPQQAAFRQQSNLNGFPFAPGRRPILNPRAQAIRQYPMQQHRGAPAQTSERVIRAQFQTPPTGANGSNPAYRVAETPERNFTGQDLSLADYPKLDPQQLVARPGEHPMMPALRWAKNGLRYLEAVDGYTATMAKRERINGTLGEYQYMDLKVRHRPFSVYIKLLGPEDMKGREAIYIAGKNDGNLVAHPTGMQKRLVGTISLKPTGMLAMQGNRYPITEVGILNLTRRLIEVGEQDMQYGECEVKYFRGAKVNDRICTCMQFVHPVPRREFRYHLARIYVDDELNLPIRYEAFNWPSKPGEEPTLTEEYTYLNLKLNPGLSDMDFDTRNPNYDYD